MYRGICGLFRSVSSRMFSIRAHARTGESKLSPEVRTASSAANSAGSSS